MQSKIIGFLGAGNMGQSLIGGLMQNGHPADQIWACDHHLETLTKLKNQYQIYTTSDAQILIEKIDVLVIAVKPQDLKALMIELQPHILKHHPLLISIAAGIQTQQIKQWTGDSIAVIRAMPNTPALLQAGITGLYADNNVSKSDQKLADTILKAVGETVWIENEAQMDIVTALSGSGPAYFFYLFEALIAGANALGLPSDIAKKLALHTALGAAKMADLSNDDLARLRQKVTSPGGTTEAGLQALEQGKLNEIVANALSAATQRGKALSQQYN